VFGQHTQKVRSEVNQESARLFCWAWIAMMWSFIELNCARRRFAFSSSISSTDSRRQIPKACERQDGFSWRMSPHHTEGNGGCGRNLELVPAFGPQAE